MNKSEKIFSYKYYYYTIVIINLLGLLLALYLEISHYRTFTDPGYASFCAISRAINCDTVAQSPWSVVGGLPVALWGMFGYSLLFILLLNVRPSNLISLSLWRLIFLLGCIFSFTSIYFAYISATKINSFCILCITNYILTFLLLIQSWLVCRRLKNNQLSSVTRLTRSLGLVLKQKKILLPVIILLITFILSERFLPHYWEMKMANISISVENGITEQGHPWIGAKNPSLVIEEFSDYQCFQCFKMQQTIRTLISKYPEKIRLIHHHYPMDHAFNPIVVPEPFHVGSGKMSLLAIYAMSKGKFWEMNDALFQLGRTKKPFNIKKLARLTGLPINELSLALTHSAIRKKLSYDILIGMKKRITATPSFIIDNKVYTGSIPQNIIEEAIRP